MKAKDIKILIICVVACVVLGSLGSLFTAPAIPSWYAGLNKPAFSPPNWLFGPVWTTLFILMGIAVYLVWEKGLGKKEVKAAVTIFCVQLVLNVLWSVMFFGLRSPLLGLIEIAVLWVMIAITISRFYKISRKAAYLMVPYILWVSFASVLNFAIFLLNR